VPDMSKPLAHLEMLIEDLHYKQIDHYRKSQDHKLQGDLYAEIGYKLKDTLDKEKAIASAVNPQGESK
jgi:hypothetical protein